MIDPRLARLRERSSAFGETRPTDSRGCGRRTAAARTHSDPEHLIGDIFKAGLSEPAEDSVLGAGTRAFLSKALIPFANRRKTSEHSKEDGRRP